MFFAGAPSCPAWRCETRQIADIQCIDTSHVATSFHFFCRCAPKTNKAAGEGACAPQQCLTRARPNTRRARCFRRLPAFCRIHAVERFGATATETSIIVGKQVPARGTIDQSVGVRCSHRLNYGPREAGRACTCIHGQGVNSGLHHRWNPFPTLTAVVGQRIVASNLRPNLVWLRGLTGSLVCSVLPAESTGAKASPSQSLPHAPVTLPATSFISVASLRNRSATYFLATPDRLLLQRARRVFGLALVDLSLLSLCNNHRRLGQTTNQSGNKRQERA
jgi:hypothetical protein